MDLRVARYQFPHPGPEQQEDANWLVIDGSVRTADGASWSFREPVLTTWEVADTVTWLRGVADGTVPAAADGDHLSHRGGTSTACLGFTEPNLGFAVSGNHGQRVRLLVGLSHECAEPPVDPHRPGRCRIAVTMSRRRVRDAAIALETELATHPAR